MFGGDTSNPRLPLVLEDNRFQYDANNLPRLQLFGDYQVGKYVGPFNFSRNEQITSVDRPTKRTREADSVSGQQKLPITLNNKLYHDEAGASGSLVNPLPMSIGLKLSCEEDEHNSSVSTVSEGMATTFPGILSLDDNLKAEMDRQKEEFDQFIRIQEENIMKGVREIKQQHATSFLHTIEKGVEKKLHEKDIEIENINCKNRELEEKIKQVSMDLQSWHYRAKYNESVVNVLKTNLQQVMAPGAMHGKEGYGDSEVDDAASYINQNYLGFGDGSGNHSRKSNLNCIACKVKEVSVLLVPCRHLCLCKDCEGSVDICPVCQVMKTASVQVYMS